MKWSNEQVNKLKEMCYKGNLAIKTCSSFWLGIVTGCLRKKFRQLGITIDKCKPRTKVNIEIDAAFRTLLNALLLEVAQDSTSLDRAEKLNKISDALIDLNSDYKKGGASHV